MRLHFDQIKEKNKKHVKYFLLTYLFSKLRYTENMATPAQNKAAKFHLITIKESKYDLL